MNLAVIPARGGSKRIPRKNIKSFSNRPMISWSIAAAKQANVFDRIIVSTDDDEIADVAKQYGAEVPFIRPARLSDDFAGTTDVIAHATEWAQEQYGKINAVCCVYATAPFVQARDIIEGLKTLEAGNWAYTFSVTDFPSTIFRAFEKDRKTGGLSMFFPEFFEKRSQDLPEALHDAAQFYWGRPASWIEGKKIFDANSAPIYIPRWRVQDIDTPEDWTRAEMLAKLIFNT